MDMTPHQFDLIDFLAALDADDSTQSHLEDLAETPLLDAIVNAFTFAE